MTPLGPRRPESRSGWPAFRTPPGAALRIGWVAVILGYVVALLGVPMLVSAVQALAVDSLRGTGITRTPAGPGLQVLEGYVQMTIVSTSLSWQGIPASLAMVLLARRADLFGWGTAMAAGVATAVLTLGLLHGMGPLGVVAGMGPPSALLGLGFWLTVRLVAPSAFRGPDAATATDARATGLSPD